MPEVSFIVLTYNSSKHITKLLDSLYKHFGGEINAGRAEVVVVDNSSSDDTVNKLKDYKLKAKGLNIVENSSNSGFAAGINVGAKNAQGKYLVTVNPDAEYEKGDVFEALREFEQDKKTGVIGGALKTYDGDMEKSCGRFLKTFEVFLLLLGLDEKFSVRTSPGKKSDVDFVSGGFMLIPKKVFLETGGFDEDFFMYIEDMELCYRLKKKGYRVVFDPEIVIIHAGQGSSSRGFAVRNIFRGLLIFQKKHGNILTYLMVRAMLFVKASLLVLAGKMLNNKYLTETYRGAL